MGRLATVLVLVVIGLYLFTYPAAGPASVGQRIVRAVQEAASPGSTAAGAP